MKHALIRLGIGFMLAASLVVGITFFHSVPAFAACANPTISSLSPTSQTLTFRTTTAYIQVYFTCAPSSATSLAVHWGANQGTNWPVAAGTLAIEISYDYYDKDGYGTYNGWVSLGSTTKDFTVTVSSGGGCC